jgi:hypothetical protein
MIYQNDEGNPEPIKKWGCYYYALLNELYKRFPLGELTNKVAIEWWNKFLKNGRPDVDGEMFIENAQNICDDIAGTGKVTFLGKYYPNHRIATNEFAIEYWRNEYIQDGERKVVYHFTGTDYDPWKGGSRTKREGQLVGYRIFRINGDK